MDKSLRRILNGTRFSKKNARLGGQMLYRIAAGRCQLARYGGL